VIAIETARRVVADVLATTASSVSALLSGGACPSPKDTATATLEEVRDFLSELREPPETEDEQFRLTSRLHALDHTSRLVELLADGELSKATEDLRTAELCIQAMRGAQTVGASITAEAALTAQAEPIAWSVSPDVAAALAEAERAARELDALQRDHRAATLGSVAPGKLTAAGAFARIEATRRIDRMAHHAWRSAAHLLGCGTPAAPIKESAETTQPRGLRATPAISSMSQLETCAASPGR
jgi:phosphate:Na+ symporter